jgi:hypothetical protein
MSGASSVELLGQTAFLPRRIDQRAIERDAGLEIGVVGRVDPHGASATAEADDAQLAGVAALALGPGGRRVEVGDQLGIRLGVDDRHQLGSVGDLGQVGALAEIVVRRHREGAELGQAARDVPDVFMQAEHLHGDQNNGCILRIGRLGEIDRHLAIRHLDLGLAGGEAAGVRGNHLGAHRPGSERIARGRCRRRRHEATPGQRRRFGQSNDIGRELALHCHS